jgi:peptide-methionine (R)-S-oxide reductase
MIPARAIIVLLASVLALLAWTGAGLSDAPDTNISEDHMPRIVKSEQEWKRQLTDMEYRVLREKGTERPFTGKYHDHKEKGVYICAGCGNELFHSRAKFDSGTGWPSFYQPSSPDSVELEKDTSLFMTRTEVLCARCGGHLGHVFDDGPAPTGKRYCINSVALDFVAQEEIDRRTREGGEEARSNGASGLRNATFALG